MSKNSNRRRAGLRVPSLAALPDFDPAGEYAEDWQPQKGSLADVVRHKGVIFLDEDIWGDADWQPSIKPLQPIELEDRRSRINWREVALWLAISGGTLLLWTLALAAAKAAA